MPLHFFDTYRNNVDALRWYSGFIDPMERLHSTSNAISKLTNKLYVFLDFILVSRPFKPGPL